MFFVWPIFITMPKIRLVPKCVTHADLIRWTIQWHHNKGDGGSNHRRLDCFNCFFRRRSKKTSKLCDTGLCEGNPPMKDGFPSHSRKMFPFDDVIMAFTFECLSHASFAAWSSRWWPRYEIETLSPLLALCEGNPPFSAGFPSQKTGNMNRLRIICCSLKRLL